jgi:hypothetical protein
MESGYVNQIRGRLNCARKVYQQTNKTNKRTSKNQWFQQQAEACDLELDDHCLEKEDMSVQSQRQSLDASRARKQLEVLLSKPLQAKKATKRKFQDLAANVPELIDQDGVGSAKATHAGREQSSALGDLESRGKKLARRTKAGKAERQ